MSKLVLIIVSIFSSVVWAEMSDWVIANEEEGLVIKNTKVAGVQSDFNAFTSDYKIVEVVEPENSPVEIIVYYAGDVGTSELVELYNAFIYNKNTKKLSTHPYFYKSVSVIADHTTGKLKIDKANWKYFDDKIQVFTKSGSHLLKEIKLD